MPISELTKGSLFKLDNDDKQLFVLGSFDKKNKTYFCYSFDGQMVIHLIPSFEVVLIMLH